MAPQSLEKSHKKYDCNIISKNFGTAPGSTKSSSTTLKALPTSTADRLTKQDLIDTSLRNSTCKNYVLSDRLERLLCREKHNLWQSYSWAIFKLFRWTLQPRSVLVSAKSAVIHVLRMKYQYIPQHPSVIKYFKRSFNLRPLLRKLSFVWNVQSIFKYFKSLGDKSQIPDNHLSRKLLALGLGGQRLNSAFNLAVDKMIISSTSVTFSP